MNKRITTTETANKKYGLNRTSYLFPLNKR